METLQVRVAVPEDVDEMMRLAVAATSENAFLPPSNQKLLETIWPALNQHHGLIGAIGPVNGHLEGAILLSIGNLWYSDQPVIEERAIFIDPDYRSAKGGRARRLCEFAKQVSNELKLPLAIGVLSNHRTAAKMRLYERMFGSPAGMYFLYGATTGAPAPLMAGDP